MLIHQWILCGIMILVFLFIFYLMIKNRKELIQSLTEMLMESDKDLLSVTRFITLYTFIAVIGVWLFLSLWNLKLEEIAASILTLLGTAATLKYVQKREETKQSKNDE